MAPLASARLARCTQHFLDTQCSYSLAEVSAVHAGAITQEIVRRRVPGECLHHLLHRPFGCWVRRDIEVAHAATVVGQNNQHEQNLEAHRGHGKEVDRHEILGMSGEEGPPSG
jgi:hypothetical protein